MEQLKNRQHRMGDEGFTLIEIMIVLIIIGFIVTLVGQNLMGKLTQSKADGTKIQMNLLEDLLDSYHLDCGVYPTSDQGLQALAEKPADLKCDRYPPGGYSKKGKVPKDGWNQDFIYESDGRTYEIISLGDDKAEGGEGVSADISSKNI